MITGIIGVTVLETVALLKGVDGAFLTMAVGAIAVIAGYVFAKRK